VGLAEWSSTILDLLTQNAQAIALAVTVIVLSFFAYHLSKRLFRWVRKIERIPASVCDSLEVLFKQVLILALAYVLALDISAILGLYEAALPIVSTLTIAGATLIIIRFARCGVEVFFNIVRASGRLPPQIVGFAEVFTKYGIVIVGSLFILLGLASGLGYSEAIGSMIVGWLTQNAAGFIFIVIILFLARFFVAFLNIFFSNLQTRVHLQPQVLNLANTASRYLVYGIVGLLLSSTVLKILGLPELSQTLVTVFAILVGTSVSFAASGTIGNILAGLLLMSWRPFDVGNRVEVGGAYGDIVEFDIVFTKVRTIKDEIISVPNLQVLAQKITNYSSLKTVIVHPKVTVGYDVDRSLAEKLLLEAVKRTEGVLGKPEPFVYVTSLGRFAVEYELNAYTSRPNELAKISSDLQKNIIDVFDEAHISLLTPEYYLDSLLWMGTMYRTTTNNDSRRDGSS